MIFSQIVPPEIGPITVPGFDKVEKTTRGNSEKLDELLKVVQNITAESGSSEIAGEHKNLGRAHKLRLTFLIGPMTIIQVSFCVRKSATTIGRGKGYYSGVKKGEAGTGR